jgi:hypothetical protein
VSVVAWDPADAVFGLRTSITRSGTLVGGNRYGDHRLFMTPVFVSDMGGFRQAIDTAGKVLVPLGATKDPYNCFYGKQCSPMVSVGVRVPDALLRASRDSLVVTFLPSVLEPWTISLSHELISAYLKKVDSVVAEMRQGSTK